MTKNLQELYFYIPWKEWVDPNCEGADPSKLRLLSDMDITHIGTAWIYEFIKNDFLCKKTSRMPEEGIFFTNRWFLDDSYLPGKNVFPICILADNRRHPFAPMHLTSNPRTGMLKPYNFLWRGFYIPHSPQQGIKPRDASRGNRFENIAFIGNPKNNLAGELRSETWKKMLSDMGLKWHIVSHPDHWTDYSYIDAILAVRSFDRRAYINKPAQKLYNAWVAGVPAILGGDSAYRAERRNEYDYIEVHSLEEAVSAIKKLRDNKDLRRRMVENGRARAAELTPDKILEKYRFFINHVAVPEYEKWRRMGEIQRRVFFMLRYVSYKIEGMRIRINRICQR